MPDAKLCVQKVAKGKYFSLLDFKDSYWQIKMSEHDIEKTAFIVGDRHLEFLRMPF